jgi:hypothetical protein
MNVFNRDLNNHPINNSSDEPINQYVDIDVFHDDDYNPSPQFLQFNQIKNINIIDNPNDYLFSVIRWSATSVLPLIIPQMMLATIPNDDTILNNTVYYISFTYNGTIYGSNVKFVPQNKNQESLPNYTIPIYQPQKQTTVLNNPYYYIYSAQYFLDLINTSLKGLFDALYAVYPTNFDSDIAPRFQWDAATNKIDLFVSQSFIDTSNQGIVNNYVKIGLNLPLYNLLNTFNFISNPNALANTRNGGDNWYFDIKSGYYDKFLALPSILPTGIAIYKISQESSSVPMWSPVSSVVFTSFTIAVNPTSSGAPEFIGKNPFKNSIDINNISSTITDFEIPLTTGLEMSNSVLYYSPVAQYRYFDLQSREGIKQLNLQVFWKSKYGTYHQYYLPYGGFATLKLLFKKKIEI